MGARLPTEGGLPQPPIRSSQLRDVATHRVDSAEAMGVLQQPVVRVQTKHQHPPPLRSTMQVCGNCGHQIGTLETAMIWNQRFVCADCHKVLCGSSRHEAPAGPRPDSKAQRYATRALCITALFSISLGVLLLVETIMRRPVDNSVPDYESVWQGAVFVFFIMLVFGVIYLVCAFAIRLKVFTRTASVLGIVFCGMQSAAAFYVLWMAVNDICVGNGSAQDFEILAEYGLLVAGLISSIWLLGRLLGSGSHPTVANP